MPVIGCGFPLQASFYASSSRPAAESALGDGGNNFMVNLMLAVFTAGRILYKFARPLPTGRWQAPSTTSLIYCKNV